MKLILLTGASGYVGGRLLRALEERGRRVRCLARHPEYMRHRISGNTQVAGGDLLKIDSLRGALQGVHVAVYLVHSMAASEGFEEVDRRAAMNFARAAREAGVRRIVYLGGLSRGTDLSPHLASREEVGRILMESGVPTMELRASIIIGSGSLSFEMVRALVEKLPVMVAPSWVRTRAQPIAIEDVITYLLAAIDAELDVSRIVEIGGADHVSYLEVLQEYARQRNLRRLILTVPVLTPRLSSLWLGLVTPVYARVGRQLIDSVRNETVVSDDSARSLAPIHPMGIRQSIARALRNEDREFAETRWSDALSSRGTVARWGGRRLGGRIVDSRTARVDRPPAIAFRPVQRIGGENGWYGWNWLWRLRGFLDLLAGGVGLRRGRPHPERLRPGDTLDFWRVEKIEPGRLLRLQAEMKVPGRAWLQFEVEGDRVRSTIRQTAIFDPRGLAGLAYWYALYPAHAAIFSRMLRGIARRAMEEPYAN